MSTLHKNGDGTYTISKGLFNVVIGVFLTATIAVVVSIISWWNGFATFQAEMREVAVRSDRLDAWYRSGEPSVLAKVKFEEMQKDHERVMREIQEIKDEMKKLYYYDRSSRKGVIP